MAVGWRLPQEKPYNSFTLLSASLQPLCTILMQQSDGISRCKQYKMYNILAVYIDIKSGKAMAFVYRERNQGWEGAVQCAAAAMLRLQLLLTTVL